jgi:hypothetical protein
MDNELDARLRRLETLLEQHRAVLDVHTERQKQTHEAVCALRDMMTEPEQDGPLLHEQMAQLIAVVSAGNDLTRKTLAAIGELGRPQTG